MIANRRKPLFYMDQAGMNPVVDPVGEESRWHDLVSFCIYIMPNDGDSQSAGAWLLRHCNVWPQDECRTCIRWVASELIIKSMFEKVTKSAKWSHIRP